MQPEPLLKVHSFSVGFESVQVLHEITFDIPQRGVLGLVGPGGAGKSTLLRSLARWNESLPSFWAKGDVCWADDRSLLHGMPIHEAQRLVPLLSQKAALYTATVLDNAIAAVRTERPRSRAKRLDAAHQVLAPLGLWEEYEPLLQDPVLSLSVGKQRKLSIARLVAGGAQCLLADEPIRDIDERDADAIRDLLRRWATEHAVVIVTHNQQIVRQMCDTVCLLFAGKVAEVTPVEKFFMTPTSRLGQKFIRTGNCSTTGPIKDSKRTSGPVVARPSWPLPGSYHWVIDGCLGGMEQPGLLNDENDDIEALSRLGCRMLVTLTEQPYKHASLKILGIEPVHFPIPDMQAPGLVGALNLCRRVSQWIDDRVPTVMHCRAGLGRTGTMLACVLVFRGLGAVAAIDQVRSINPYYIQSLEQLAFLAEFESYTDKHKETTRAV